MSEFTGERLVPGEVDADLWNEHISRYAFAASLLPEQGRVLDAGCGTGYGASFLAKKAKSVLGIDISSYAVECAVRRYKDRAVSFTVASCESMPVPDGTVGLIVAFEVIEHLSNWSLFLEECRRVLAHDGILVVSTPNKDEYAEARGDAGPNPYHVHEFDLNEFAKALERVFPNVRIFGQNHSENITFRIAGEWRISGYLESVHSEAEQAGFFVAVCGKRELPQVSNFVYVPESGNLLRERERHIALLRGELALKDKELNTVHDLHSNLVDRHREQTAELRRSNDWALSLDQAGRGKSDRIVELQEELAETQSRSRDQLSALEKELLARTEWERDLDAQLSSRVAELAACVNALHAAEETAGERTGWALTLQAEIDGARMEIVRLRAEADALRPRIDLLHRLESSRLVRYGRRLNLAPRI